MLVMSFFIVSCKENLTTQVNRTVNGIVFVINIAEDANNSIGTGFFIQENLIVTNNHVIDGSKQVFIKTRNSNKKYEAEVIARSPESDIALIKIKDWKSFDSEIKWIQLSFADSSRVKQGNEIWTFGHPWGLDYTVSRGIVSSTREVMDGGPQSFIQFDARAYQGNSGGPLFNKDAKVIGVISRLIAQTGGSYGCAIDGDLVQKVIEELLERGEVYWCKLGVKLTENENGDIVIKEIQTGSNAETFGLQVDDVIEKIHTRRSDWSGIKIIEFKDLVRELTYIKKDDEFKMTVVRDDRKKVIILRAK